MNACPLKPLAEMFESCAAAGLGRHPAGTRFLLAVSGGADSVAMTTALMAATKAGEEKEYLFSCIHVEHGIRPEAERHGDAESVQTLCESLQIPCRIVSIPPGRIAATAKQHGIGMEAAARQFRHAAWNEEARRIGAARVLVAHTQDDRLETLLMRIIRGAGPGGLALMPRERGRIIRPVLELTRNQVLAYLQVRGIRYRTDSTNTDIHYLRNRVRLKLIPCLDTWFPHWRQALLHLGETQALTALFLATEAQCRIPWTVTDYINVTNHPNVTDNVSTPGTVFTNAPLILREEALFQAADCIARGRRVFSREEEMETEGLETQTLRRTTVRRFAQATEESTKIATDAGPVRFVLQDGMVNVSAVSPDPVSETGFALVIREPGVYKAPGLHIRCVPLEGESRSPCSPDAASLQIHQEPVVLGVRLPVVLRSAVPGERGKKRRNLPSLRMLRDSTAREWLLILEWTGHSGYTSAIAKEIVVAEDGDGPLAHICLVEPIPGGRNV